MSKSTKQLFIDRTALTLGITSDKRKKAKDHFFELLKNGVLSNYMKYRGKKSNSYKGYKYEHTALFTYKSKKGVGTATIQIQPVNKDPESENNFLRVEFNPSNFTKKGINRIFRLIEKILEVNIYQPKKRNQIFTRWNKPNFNLTRIDATIDILGITPNEFLVLADKFSKPKINRNKVTGEIMTIKHGSAKRIINIYNKREEILESSNIIFLPLKNKTRIEITIRPYKSLYLLYTLPNPFNGLSFYSNTLNPDEFDDEFMHDIKENGLQYARTQARKDGKRNILDKLEKYKIELFDKDKVWNKCSIKHAFRFIKELIE